MELAAHAWVQELGREAKWEAETVTWTAVGQVCLLRHTELSRGPRTYVFKEEVKLPMVLRVDGGVEEGQEDVLQHLPKVWQ